MHYDDDILDLVLTIDIGDNKILRANLRVGIPYVGLNSGTLTQIGRVVDQTSASLVGLQAGIIRRVVVSRDNVGEGSASVSKNPANNLAFVVA